MKYALHFAFMLLLAIALPGTTLLTAAETAPDEPWGFITRNGNQLVNAGKPFRFSGMNIHWLGLDDPDNGIYPSFVRIKEAFDAAQAMGAKVVRSHTLGCSVGCPNCLEPALNQWNDGAFNTIDYAIKMAHEHHIRLIVPLVDNWHYYHGGKHTFTEWEGLKDENAFFSDSKVIRDFKAYIAQLLEHRNQYTGIALKDDPTIMAWETGNELENGDGHWSDSWTENIARYIKSLAPGQLVLDGHISSASANRNLTEGQLALPDVDMYTGHFYPPRTAFMQQDAALARAANKVYIVGEYDWSDQDIMAADGNIKQAENEKNDGQYSAHVTVIKNNFTNGYYIQLGQSDIGLQAGKPYQLSFYAKSPNAQHIEVMLQHSQYPYLVYWQQKIALTPEWQRFTYSYMPPMPYPQTNLWFNLARDEGDIYLDSVSLEQGNTELLKNGSFEQAGNDWLTPWHFQIKKGGDTFLDFIQAIERTSGVSGDLFWQLYDNEDPRRGDKYTLHYPGTTQMMRDRVEILTYHAGKM